jgi:hypothetical protein
MLLLVAAAADDAVWIPLAQIASDVAFLQHAVVTD